jgi:RNA polymerase sigma-70 factor (TIGR02943 family)
VSLFSRQDSVAQETGFLTLRPQNFFGPARRPRMSDFPDQVQTLRPQLLRYARNQLRNDAWAEDAVSETLLAALEKPLAYTGAAQLKTWLIGILKHKVIDQIRRHRREVSITSDDDREDLDGLLFKADGHWQEMPADWGNPGAALGQRQFFDVLEACMEHLPGQQGRVFVMREWLELDTEEICKETGVTATNLFVLLHRARLRLRECLQVNWFNGQQAKT